MENYNYDYLMHYGVKGMKWGVRRYQNKDGTLTAKGVKRYQKQRNKQANKAKDRSELLQERTIPAGTKMYRVSTDKNELLNGSSIYVSYLDVDRNHYRNGYIRRRNKADNTYEYQFTLKNDLKIPSREKQLAIINEVVKSNEKYLHESVKGWVDQAIPKGSMGRKYLETEYDGGVEKFVEQCKENWRNNTPSQLAYSVSQSLGLAPKVKQEIIDKLQKEGFNAMVDEASVGGQNGWAKEGYDPLIIFNSNVLSTDKVESIDRYAENAYLQRDNMWRNKANSAKNRSAQWSAM